MFSFLDRRKQRLEKLAILVQATSDQVLAETLLRFGPDEVAFILKTLPIDRSNRILSGFSMDVIKAALTLSKESTPLSDRKAAKFIDELSEDRLSGPVVDQGTKEVPITTPTADLHTPISVKALDLAGKVLGKFANDAPKSD